MRRGPKGEKRSADVIGNAVHVMSLVIAASVSDTHTCGQRLILWK